MLTDETLCSPLVAHSGLDAIHNPNSSVSSSKHESSSVARQDQLEVSKPRRQDYGEVPFLGSQVVDSQTEPKQKASLTATTDPCKLDWGDHSSIGGKTFLFSGLWTLAGMAQAVLARTSY